MSAPNGAAERLLQTLRTLGDITSIELAAHLGLGRDRLAPLLTQLHYLERSGRVKRVGMRQLGTARPCVLWRALPAGVATPMRRVGKAPKPALMPRAPRVPRVRVVAPAKRSPGQVAMREQLYVQTVARQDERWARPTAAQTVDEFQARGGVIEVLPGVAYVAPALRPMRQSYRGSGSAA